MLAACGVSLKLANIQEYIDKTFIVLPGAHSFLHCGLFADTEELLGDSGPEILFPE